MKNVKIFLLGKLDITKDGKQVQLIVKKEQALLAYLIAEKEKVFRKKLLFIFWPDLYEESAQHNLRQRIYVLKKCLNADDKKIIQSERDYIYYKHHADIFVDIKLLEESVKLGKDKKIEAVNLYRGDFLEDFFLTGEDKFNEWLLTKREYFKNKYVEILNSLVKEAHSRGLPQEAILWAEKSLNKNANQEDIYNILILSLYLSGRRQLALEKYETLKKTLEQNGEALSYATGILHEKIIHKEKIEQMRPAPLSKSTAVNIVSPAVFYGRDVERNKIKEDLDSPSGRIILIRGVYGIGKTILVEKVLADYDKSCQILSTRCYEQLKNSSYYVLIDLLRKYLRNFGPGTLYLDNYTLLGICKILPEAFTDLKINKIDFNTLSDIKQSDIIEAASSLLEQASKKIQLILFIDDVQWIDQLTLEWFEFFIEKILENKIKIILAFDEGFKIDYFLKLVSNMRFKKYITSLELKGIGKDAVCSWVKEALNLPGSQKLADRLYLSTHGKPILINEIINETKENPSVLKGNILDSIVKESVNTLVLNRFHRLNSISQKILKMASITDLKLSSSILYNILNNNKAVYLQTGELIRQGFLIARKAKEIKTIEIANEDYKRIFLNTFSPGEEQMYHRDIAEYIEKSAQLKTSYTSLFYHFKKAEDCDKTLYYANLLADKSMQIPAYQEALFYNQQILNLESDCEKQYRVKLKIAEIYNFLGKFEKSLEQYEECLKDAPPDERYSIYREISFCMVNMGRSGQARKILEENISRLETLKSKKFQHILLKSRHLLFQIMNDSGQFKKVLKKIEPLLKRLPVDVPANIRGGLFYISAYAHHYLCSFNKSIVYFKKSIEVFKKNKIIYGQGICLCMMAYVAIAQEDFIRADTYIKECLNLAKRYHLKIIDVFARVARAKRYCSSGEYFKALECGLDALKDLDTYKHSFQKKSALSIITEICIELKDFKKAKKYYDCLKDTVEKNDPYEIELLYLQIKFKLSELGAYKKDIIKMYENLICKVKSFNIILRLSLIYLEFAKFLIKSGQKKRGKDFLILSLGLYRKMNNKNKIIEIEKLFKNIH